MRRETLFAAIVGFGLVLGAGPAVATDQSTAVKICAKNPQCGLMRYGNGVTLWVDRPGGGPPDEVQCPDQGECVCTTCGGGRPARVGGDIGYIIRPLGNAPVSLSEQSSPGLPPPAPPVEIPNFG